jgi:glycine/D-amino acid oxidase-like deaminating enzyme
MLTRLHDAIVVGAGIVRAACAYAMSRAGLSVIVIEAKAAASGTSGQGEGNILISDKESGAESPSGSATNRVSTTTIYLNPRELQQVGEIQRVTC